MAARAAGGSGWLTEPLLETVESVEDDCCMEEHEGEAAAVSLLLPPPAEDDMLVASAVDEASYDSPLRANGDASGVACSAAAVSAMGEGCWGCRMQKNCKETLTETECLPADPPDSLRHSHGAVHEASNQRALLAQQKSLSGGLRALAEAAGLKAMRCPRRSWLICVRRAVDLQLG